LRGGPGQKLNCGLFERLPNYSALAAAAILLAIEVSP
jgi:hypothetical protein